MFSACVTSRSSSHRANQQECSPPCLTNFSPHPHNSHQTRFLSCVWRRLIKWYHSGCVLCLEASQSGVCRAAFLRISPSPCSVLGSVENYKYVATSIAATSRVWVGWDATSKKSDWWQAVRNITSAHPGGWHVACPSTSVTLHERNDNFLISVSFLTSTLNKSHWKINACHVKGDTRTGKVSWCYSTLSKHQTEGYENSQPPRCIMVLFFTPSVKQSGPVAGVTLLMLIGVDSPRSLRLFHLSPAAKRLQAVPLLWRQLRSAGREPPVANVSGQVMKQCSVFISVR